MSFLSKEFGDSNNKWQNISAFVAAILACTQIVSIIWGAHEHINSAKYKSDNTDLS